MAVGFTPKHIEHFHLDELSPEQFLMLAKEAVEKLEWRLDYISNSGLIAYTANGMFTWNAELKIKIENGIAAVQSSSTGNDIWDLGKNKKSVFKFLSVFKELQASVAPGELLAKYEDIKDQFVPPEEDILTKPPATAAENIKSFFSIFIPTPGFFITPILIDLNILIFILMVLSGVDFMEPDTDSLLAWGANFRPMTLEGEWWRLITNTFLHIGIFHLLMNMYALLYIGVLLEPHLGRTRFLTAYLLTGITASVASLWWHDLIVSAGASGAIFGMYGVFLALLTTNFIEKEARKALLTSIALFVGYNLVYGLKGGIDNAAHLGGLIGGLIIGYALIPSLKKPEEINLKFGTIAVLGVLILTSSFVVYKKLPNDIGKYDAEINQFISNEAMALDVFKLPQNTSKEELIYGLKDIGLYYWNENLKLVTGLDELNLPVELRTRNRLLKEYCELRIKSYELIIKAISENSARYRVPIEACQKQINVKLNALGVETGAL